MPDGSNYNFQESGGAEMEQGEGISINNIRQEIAENIREGKKVLVVGSGPNTDLYSSMGVDTLDLDPQWNPSSVGDANKMSEALNGKTFNLIYAESLPLTYGGDPQKLGGVHLERLAEEAKKLLQASGTLIVKAISTADINTVSGGLPSPTPKPSEAVEILKKAGFQNVQVELGPDHMVSDSPKTVGDKVIAYTGFNERLSFYRATA